ncbi:HB2J protein, partial [Callaeas wilsoni]|nr:HB2J protein [Callaeas wilsoni]
PPHTGVFQELTTSDCRFFNSTDRVKFVERFIYNQEQYANFDSDVGHFVGYTSFGEKFARYWNNLPDSMEVTRAQVDGLCRHNYEVFRPFLMER